MCSTLIATMLSGQLVNWLMFRWVSDEDFTTFLHLTHSHLKTAIRSSSFNEMAYVESEMCDSFLHFNWIHGMGPGNLMFVYASLLGLASLHLRTVRRESVFFEEVTLCQMRLIVRCIFYKEVSGFGSTLRLANKRVLSRTFDSNSLRADMLPNARGVCCIKNTSTLRNVINKRRSHSWSRLHQT